MQYKIGHFDSGIGKTVTEYDGDKIRYALYLISFCCRAKNLVWIGNPICSCTMLLVVVAVVGINNLLGEGSLMETVFL